MFTILHLFGRKDRMMCFHKYSNWSGAKPQNRIIVERKGIFPTAVLCSLTYETMVQTKSCTLCNKVKMRTIGAERLVSEEVIGGF